MKHTIGLLLCCLLMIGCGGKKDPGQKVLPRSKQPPAVPAAKAIAVEPALRQQARDVILAGLSDANPVIRAHAIEAIQKAWPEQADSIPPMLRDDSAVARFAAALAIGQLKLESAKPQLPGLLEDRNTSVRVAAIYALHRLGDFRSSHELEKLSQNDNPSVRSNVALVLGLMDDPSARNVLRPMQRDRNAGVKLQVLESLWRLRDEAALDDLIGSSMSKYPDEQMVAILALAGPRDVRVRGQIRGLLTHHYPEVCLVAARAMGELGSDAGYGVAMEGVQSRDPRHRSLAALAFGSIARADAQDRLAPLLKDPSPEARLSAALAVLQLR